ncbi:sugar phosphorylase [Pseudoalteromonas ruthenica]|uniref:sugar phosphorylase n=1 Tax=Pseudoalteromonas ruthenica TaxID=151081 RepID=UPI00110A1499|nr:sugar phosphorylase [Pseudoalteromonas ruthenica]TMO47982.1 alpha-amylase [Pseudoalteromonas ruthenica]TMO49715.1 alpha-amylase [Pseudoalteromonas ruthenica]
MTSRQRQFEQRVTHHLAIIYAGILDDAQCQELAAQLLESMLQGDVVRQPTPHKSRWDERDAVLICYGDSVNKTQAHEPHTLPTEPPLYTLKQFLDTYTEGAINSVHILPFYPYSSDEGFSVMNYVQVNEALGSWQHINDISKDYRLMADLVINHCSSKSLWFSNFIANVAPGKGYFKTANVSDNLDDVVRPRTSELLNKVRTAAGEQHVWCTFSHDQVDFDFANPQVLREFVAIIRFYLDNGVRLFRLDAVAFLWKVPGTSCINLPQTHEVVRLLRTLIEHVQPQAIIITETNIPNEQNLSYFGNANEAHCIYNFSLPPLLLHTLTTGDCTALKKWMMRMPPAQDGTAYFNFIASHDGIGLRPAEGLLDTVQINALVACMQRFGAKVSWRTQNDGTLAPYEINIALFDALQGAQQGPDNFAVARFLCAHAIMLALEGIPGVYIHSLTGTENDYERFNNTQHNRAINRHRWHWHDLEAKLADPHSHHQKVHRGMLNLLKIRGKQKAFHPNATQFTLHLGQEIFGFWRQSADRQQSIFCLFNISNQPQTLSLEDLNLVNTQPWCDLLSDIVYKDMSTCLSMRPYQAIWLTNTTT